jgi:hypothetical protein
VPDPAKPWRFRFTWIPLGPDSADAAVLARFREPMPRTPVVTRDRAARVRITGPDDSVTLRYTLDGSEPGIDSTRYTGAFRMESAGTVRARAFAVGRPPSRTATLALEATRALLDVDETKWRVAAVSSEQPGEGWARHAIDGRDDTFWHSNWQTTREPHPHTLDIDLGESLALLGVEILPRQDSSNGRIRDYEIWGAARLDEPRDWRRLAEGRLADGAARQRILFDGASPARVRLLRVVSRSEGQGRYFSTIAELDVLAIDDSR